MEINSRIKSHNGMQPNSRPAVDPKPKDERIPQCSLSNTRKWHPAKMHGNGGKNENRVGAQELCPQQKSDPHTHTAHPKYILLLLLTQLPIDPYKANPQFVPAAH